MCSSVENPPYHIHIMCNIKLILFFFTYHIRITPTPNEKEKLIYLFNIMMSMIAWMDIRITKPKTKKNLRNFVFEIQLISVLISSSYCPLSHLVKFIKVSLYHYLVTNFFFIILSASH